MPQDIPLITTIATALGVALLMGFIAIKCKLPTVVGYLLAGVIIGPFTPGLIANVEIAKELSDIGVMLLMFGVGLHFSLNDLLDVRKIALPGALVQIAVATALGTSVAILWGWPLGSALVFGLSLSVASTVVLVRTLEARGALESINGRIAVGWLVVEDLAMVLVLVILPPLAGWLGGNTPVGENQSLGFALSITFLKVTTFIAMMLIVGRRVFPKVLWHIARTGSRELFTLCVVATAVGIAYVASTIFGMSFALGAFFAGMIMRESKFSQRAAEESLPLREAFAVLFFVSVGMLFDPNIFIERPLQVLAIVSIIVIGKSIAASILVLSFRYPLSSALTVSASLAQIGEFSFILAALGAHLGLLPTEGLSLICAGALISIAINPLLFKIIVPIQQWIYARPHIARTLESAIDPLAVLPLNIDKKYLSGQVILVGYGHMGKSIAKKLTKKGIPYIIAEQNRVIVKSLRKHQTPAVSGDASDPSVLIQAHIARASILVITIMNSAKTSKMLKTAQRLNPAIETVIRVHETTTAATDEKTEPVCMGKEELAELMSEYVLERFGKI